MRMFLTPKWLLSHVFVAAMIVAMIGAAFWQLDRLDQKRASNDQIRAASEAAPALVEDLLERIADGEDVLDHTAVIVRGTYRTDLEVLVANRTFDTQPGSWLATPVELADGRLVMVSRGWVSRRWVAGDDPRSAATPDGEVTIEGRLFSSVDGGRIGSGTETLAEVSRMDLDRVAETLDIHVVDRWVQLATQSPAADDLPIAVPPPTLDDGPHLSYAFQWFFFTIGTVIAYTLILRRRRREAAIKQSAE